MRAVIVDTEVQCVDDVLDDLTEREGDDREVVALQTKDRNTDQETEDSRCRCTGTPQREPEEFAQSEILRYG